MLSIKVLLFTVLLLQVEKLSACSVGVLQLKLPLLSSRKQGLEQRLERAV
ncbi:hypothetical protein OESDEN_15661 [Oesophagostomum dentatum]|uniref:Uncharacterized protein n=1 Tax=Oesophagostomum dentatum TaxID=61180 RepID=A0A0B1SH47_OESDE|nr:hypothetical protein OESDEN_15661 [Oesophagostomum dentatum]